MSKTPAIDLKVGYLNVRGFTTEKFEYTLSLLDNGYHIVFISETWFVNQAHYQASPTFLISSPYPNRTSTSGHPPGGLMAFVRPSIRHMITSFTTTRTCLSITVFGLTFYALYLPPSLPVEQLVIPIADGTTPVILGDINTRFGSTFQDSTSGPRNRMNFFADLSSKYSLRHIPPTTGTTRVDHVYLSGQIKGQWESIDTGLHTDHPLIYLCIDIAPLVAPNPNPVTSTWRFYLKYLDEEAYSTALAKLFSELSQTFLQMCRTFENHHRSMVLPVKQEIINTLNFLLVDLVCQCAEQILGSYDASSVKMQLDQLPSLLNTASSTTAATRLFKRSQRMNSAKVFIHSRDPNITPVKDAVQFFEQVFAQKSSYTFKLPPVNLDEESFDIIKMFHHKAISSFIARYPTTKSCGLDGVHVRLLRALLPTPSGFISCLSQLFNIIAKTGCIPNSWNLSLISPIPKAPESQTINSFRPVSLTCMFRRCFEGVLLHGIEHSFRLAHLMEMHPFQGGFRRGFSCITHALTSSDSSYCGVKTRVFIDFSQAYDKVDVQILLHKLFKRSAPPLLIHIISALFTRCSSQVVVNGQLSPSFHRHSGLFQGSLLSPWLFNIYINDLAEQLSICQDPNDTFPCALLFADDIQLLASSNIQAQCMTDIVVTWAHNNAMSANLSKSGVCSVFQDTNIMLENDKLPVLSSYKYLGFPHSASTILWKDYTSKCILKARNLFKYVQTVSTHWPEWIRLTIYRTFIRPIFDYGAPLIWHWCQSLPTRKIALSEYENLQKECMSWVFSKSSPLSVLYSIAGIPTVTSRFEGMATTFTLHISTLSPGNPLLRILNSHKTPPWPDEFLSPRCLNTTLLQQFLNRDDPEVRLPTFIKKQYCLSFQTGSLTAIIKNSCRINHYGTDKLVYLRNVNARSLAIKWRCGHVGLHHLCPCQQLFSRSHLHSCQLLQNHPSITPAVYKRFTQEQESFSEFTYTILDSLLNHSEYEDFHSCCLSLLEMLTPA